MKAWSTAHNEARVLRLPHTGQPRRKHRDSRASAAETESRRWSTIYGKNRREINFTRHSSADDGKPGTTFETARPRPLHARRAPNWFTVGRRCCGEHRLSGLVVVTALDHALLAVRYRGSAPCRTRCDRRLPLMGASSLHANPPVRKGRALNAIAHGVGTTALFVGGRIGDYPVSLHEAARGL